MIRYFVWRVTCDTQDRYHYEMPKNLRRNEFLILTETARYADAQESLERVTQYPAEVAAVHRIELLGEAAGRGKPVSLAALSSLELSNWEPAASRGSTAPAQPHDRDSPSPSVPAAAGVDSTTL